METHAEDDLNQRKKPRQENNCWFCFQNGRQFQLRLWWAAKDFLDLLPKH